MKHQLKICLLAFFMAFLSILSTAQEPANSSGGSGCGKSKVSLANPKYIITGSYIFAVESPSAWDVVSGKGTLVKIVLHGENFDSARTVMYVNIQKLDSTFDESVKKDQSEELQSCPQQQVIDIANSPVLEAGCEQRTQKYTCKRDKNPTVELVTKVNVNGILLNFVLTSNDESEITKYKKDYEFLLMHFARVK